MSCSAQGVSMNASFTDHFSCKICLEILNEPVQCQRNEHYFCTPCIKQHLVQSQTCPLCMEELTLETLRPASRVVVEVLSQLRTPCCDFVHRGCKEKVAIQDLPAHREVCGFAPAICSNESCGATINRQDVVSHESESCNFRKVKCVDCAEEIIFQVYGRHPCVLKRDVDEIKSRVKEIQIAQEVMQETLNTCCQIVKDLQDPLRNVTSSSLIFVAGGCDYAYPNTGKTFEIFDWSTKTWALHEDIFFYPHKHSFSFSYKNNIMVCGGTNSNRIEYVNIRKDPITTSSFAMSLPESRRNPGGKGALCGNHIFMFENGEVREIVLDSTPSSSSKAVLTLSKYKRFYGVECINENIFILGGDTEEKQKHGARQRNALDTVLLYDTSINEMKTLAPLPYGVSEMATVSYQDNIIILGGKDSYGNPFNSVSMYNINSQECHRLPSMLQKRSGCAAVIMEEVIIVMGGDSGSGYLNTVEYFVLGQDSWHELPTMHYARYGATACVLP